MCKVMTALQGGLRAYCKRKLFRGVTWSVLQDSTIGNYQSQALKGGYRYVWIYRTSRKLIFLFCF